MLSEIVMMRMFGRANFFCLLHSLHFSLKAIFQKLGGLHGTGNGTASSWAAAGRAARVDILYMAPLSVQLLVVLKASGALGNDSDLVLVVSLRQLSEMLQICMLMRQPALRLR